VLYSLRIVRIELGLARVQHGAIQADQKMRALAQTFQKGRTILGPYYENAARDAEHLSFQGVPQKRKKPPTDMEIKKSVV
jgi:hypothetical protein